MMVCRHCGGTNPPGSRFCGHPGCGQYLGWDENPGWQPGAATPPPEPGEYGVRLDLGAAPEGELRAGEQVRVGATVRNTGTLVDEFVLTISAPAPWVRVEPARLSVYPGDEEAVTVLIAPPPAPAPPAGPLPYRLVVRSALRPHVTAVADGGVLLAPVDAVAAEVSPSTSTGRGSARARVLVRNDGNRQVLVALDRADREPGVAALIAPAVLELPAGAAGEAEVRLTRRRRRWLGQSVRHPYRVRVQPHPGEPRTVDGAFVQQPVFPAWLPRTALVAVPLLVVGGVLLARHDGGSAAATTTVAGQQTTPAARPVGSAPASTAASTSTAPAPTTPPLTSPPAQPTTAPPTTAPPTTTVPPTPPFDLLANGNRATWRNGTSELPFNGNDSDDRGFVLIRAPAPLNDGSGVPIALETHPQWVDDGFIEGDFQLPAPIRRGDHVTAKLAFLQGAGGAVRYSVLAVDADGTAHELASKDLAAADQPADLDVDLSPARGAPTLRLRVDAAGSSGQDWALWIEPRLVGRQSG